MHSRLHGKSFGQVPVIYPTTIEIKAGKDTLVSKTKVVPYRVILRQLDGNVRIQLCLDNAEFLVPAKFLEQNSFTVKIENTVNCQYVTLQALLQVIGGSASEKPIRVARHITDSTG